MEALRRVKDEVGFDSLLYDDQIGKVSLIGAGMRSHPGMTAKFFAALAEAGVNIEMISTSEIRISVIVDEDEVNEAVTATHTAFDLDSGRGRGGRLRRERPVSAGPARAPRPPAAAAVPSWPSSAPPARSARSCARSCRPADDIWRRDPALRLGPLGRHGGCGSAGEEVEVQAITPDVFDGVDIAMFSAVPDEVSVRLGPGSPRPAARW